MEQINIIGREWPEWKIEEVLGRGSFGTVYRASRNVYENSFESAIKVITIPQQEQELNQLRIEGLDEASIIN